MLDMAFDFYFPRLVHLREDYFLKPDWPELSNPYEPNATPDGYKKKPVQLYKLDWASFNKRKQSQFDEWKQKYHPKDKNLRFVPSLPEKYELVYDLIFCLDYKYLTEIWRCCQTALIERGRHRPFDTMIRDICQEPVHAYVYVAFRLICDCIFDEKKHGYRDHDWVRRISWHAMLYSFWSGQTGRGLLWDRARMDELDPEKWAGCKLFKPLEKEAEEFWEDMKKHEEHQIVAGTPGHQMSATTTGTSPSKPASKRSK